MKRFLSIGLLIIYVLVSVGFTVQLHWCGSKLAALSIEHVAIKSCSCEKDGTEKLCHSCKSTEASFKLNVIHQSINSLNLIVFLPFQGEIYTFYQNLYFHKIGNLLCTFDWGEYKPPVLSSTCSLLI